MAERPYTGLTAQVKINGILVGYMSGIDLNIEKSIIEILQFGAKYADKVPAQRKWSATVDGTFALAPGGSQEKLWLAFDNDELVELGLFLDDNTWFEGNAYIGNLKISTAPDDKTSISCDLEGAGQLSLETNVTYRCVATSGVGGTMTPGGAQNIKSGESITYTITPSTGFTLDTLTDNDADVKTSVESNKYTIANVKDDHVVVATFVANRA